MKIAIVDADLNYNTSVHRFPNLASMKISSYHKSKDDDVELVVDYDMLRTGAFDKIYISKVFTSTIVPDDILLLPNVERGGTGFFYDVAPFLDDEIEHTMPDYTLYLHWVENMISTGWKVSQFKYYTDFSIGYTTRGCVRGCEFCVNKNSRKIVKWSPVEEFLDIKKQGICLLDDNILMFPNWQEIFDELNGYNIPFQYKQGMDERALTRDKIKTLLKSRYMGDYIFAFDNIEDREIIERNLCLWKESDTQHKRLKFYVLCGFDRENKWDDSFWLNDIYNTFLRIKILMKYQAMPYIMRYERVYGSSYSDVYTQLAGWCNQPSLFKNMSFEEYCIKKGISEKVYKIYKNYPVEYLESGGKKGKPWRTLDFLKSIEIQDLEKFITMRFPK